MRNRSRIGGLVLTLAVASTAMIVGCATAPPLNTEIATSSIRAAEEVGADTNPRAALQLQLAKEGLQRAEALAAEGEAERASSMLARAEVDAELAIAIAHEDDEIADAQEALDRVRQLQ